MKRKHRVMDSFNYAIRGLFHALRTERNMKIHLVAAILAVGMGFVFRLSSQELLFILMAVVIVVITELFNTAMEKLGDVIAPNHDDKVRQAKDICAGAVLVSAIFALVTGYLVFQNKALGEMKILMASILDSPIHFAFLTTTISLGAVIVIKVITRKGTPLRGGFPSVHSAVAFCLATVVALVTRNIYGGLFALIIAGMVAQSRMNSRIHTILEVVFGGLLGISVTLLLYRILEGFL